jgi:hypothetical protein
MKTAFHPTDLAGIQVRPSRLWTQSLSWMLFIVGVILYAQLSIARHKENPEDRVVPSARQLMDGVKASVLEPAEEDDPLDPSASLSERIRHSMLWKDTVASARRFLTALALLVPAILLGLHMAVFPYFGAVFQRFVLFFDKIVALSLLPILFIAFGIDEWSKIMLMVIGVARTDREGLHAEVDQLRCCVSSRAEAGSSADHQQCAAEPQAACLVSLCRRDDRFDRRTRVSHRHHAPPHGHGHHSPLLAVGRVVAVST